MQRSVMGPAAGRAGTNRSIVVFSELDDTLFDARDCRIEPRARDAIERLHRERIPIVLCSRKTRAEVELVQQELGIAHPFMCESGAAVFIPRGYFAFDLPRARRVAAYEVVELGRPYDDVVSILHRVADRAGIDVIGFSDMSVAEVASECDLPLLEARLAKLREYSEPFRAADTAADDVRPLIKMLRAAGLECTHHGHLWHLSTARVDTGVQLLCRCYRRALGRLLTIAFTDRASAAPLRGADIRVIVRSDRLDVASLRRLAPAARLATVDSVAGWVDAILDMSDAVQRRGHFWPR